MVFFNARVSPSSDPPFFWINKFGRLFSLSYLSFNLKKGNWDSLATDYVEIPGKNTLQYFRRVLAFSLIFSLLVLCLLHAAFIWDNHWPHCKFYCHLANLWDGKGKTHFELNNNLIERISTVEPRLSVLLDHPDFFFGPNFFTVIN